MASQVDQPYARFWRADSLMPGVVASAVGYTMRGSATWLHRGLPSPHLTFILTLDEPVITAWSADGALSSDAARLDIVTAGLHLAPAYIRQPPAQSGIQLAMHPATARTIFGLPASELSHASYEGRDVLGAAVSRLRDRVIQADGWDARFSLVEEFLHQLADRAQSRPQLRPEVMEAWSWLAKHRGAGRISTAADHVLLSQRQLHSLFTAEFGIGPKRFNRLLRFDRAKRLITGDIDHGRHVDLAGTAARCGYADQSHLTRDFVAFTGISPRRWLAEELGAVVAGGYR